jgi:hypothetical protein
MLLNKVVLEGLKGTLAHNTAQIILQSDKAKGYEYLSKAQALFLTMGVDMDQASEIITFARLKSRAEVKLIRNMYERYGINTSVQGDGGSAIALETLLEIALAKGEL